MGSSPRRSRTSGGGRELAAARQKADSCSSSANARRCKLVRECDICAHIVRARIPGFNLPASLQSGSASIVPSCVLRRSSTRFDTTSEPGAICQILASGCHPGTARSCSTGGITTSIRSAVFLPGRGRRDYGLADRGRAPARPAGQQVLRAPQDTNAEANPELSRLALKLATGAGKTTVMAMLIAGNGQRGASIRTCPSARLPSRRAWYYHQRSAARHAAQRSGELLSEVASCPAETCSPT